MSDRRSESRQEDIGFIQMILSGQKDQFRNIMEKYYLPLMDFLVHLNVPADQREDIAQDAFVKAFTKLHSFDRQRPFMNWLFTIARNSYFDDYRKRSKSAALFDRSFEKENPSVEEKVIRSIALQEILEHLPPEQKLLFEMRVFKGLSFDEIGSLLGESVSALRMRFSRLMGKLRERMGKEVVDAKSNL